MRLYLLYLDIDLDFTLLDNYLFGSVKLTKNSHPAKYKYSSYTIGFDFRSEFLFQMETTEKMLLFVELI